MTRSPLKPLFGQPTKRPHHLPQLRLPAQAAKRLGGVSVLMAIVLPVLAILAAFCINIAHMQLVKTEVAIASDAAARAAGRAFSEEQSVEAAKNAAIATAALNDVNHEPMQLSFDDGSNDIEFGVAAQNGQHGRFQFTKVPTSQVGGNEITVSAVRINAKRDSNSVLGPVDMIFPTAFARADFEPTHSSVAMQVDRDISLVLDRSGSMEWPTYDWPAGENPWDSDALDAAVDAGVLYRNWRGNLYYSSGENQYSYYEFVWEEHLELGPRPPTPWEDLVVAVDAFLNVLDQTPQNEQVSVASYSNNGSLDEWLVHDYDQVRSIVNSLNTGGGTGIGNGMNSGIQSFTHSNARPFASKTMVVMTDGNHNSGTSPQSVATSLMASHNMNIQTVTFGGGANQSAMQQVATTGAGKHYHAESGQELVSVFEEIANNLPTILTE